MKAAAVVDGEMFDAEPTALEMAFYCTPDAPRLWRVFTALSQPVAITLPCAFAARLLLSPLWWAFVDFDQYRALRLAGTVMVIACIPRLARLWVAAGRTLRYPSLRRDRRARDAACLRSGSPVVVMIGGPLPWAAAKSRWWAEQGSNL